MSSLIIKPLSPLIGAEISNIDLGQPLKPNQRKLLRNALNDHQILVFRKQHITPKQYVKFANCFGISVANLKNRLSIPGYPQIAVLDNKKVKGKYIGFVAEKLWHEDGCFMGKKVGFKNRLLATVLYALKAPRSGGETLFSNARSAYEGLPNNVKKQIKDKMVTYLHPEDKSTPIRRRLVYKNKFNGKSSLYLTYVQVIRIIGMQQASSEKLLKSLYKLMIAKNKIYRHKWRKGDILIWDDQSVLHAATNPPKTRRLLHRIFIEEKINKNNRM